MTRTLWLAVFLLSALAPALYSQNANAPSQRQDNQVQTPKPSEPPDEALPPEEDETVKPKVYAFDPLESDRNIKVGNFYMHKGTPAGYRAALGRYEDAAKYNPNSAEAFFKVGEAEEKLNNKDAAKIAFTKVIKLAPDSKLAHDAKKKLDSKELTSKL